MQVCRAAQDASASTVSASSTTQASQSAEQDRSPTGFERACSAFMFLLPLSEGCYRLALIAVHNWRRNALDLLIWCKVQQGQILAGLAESGLSQSQPIQDELVRLAVLMQ
eukprot:jgi/Chrzof1/5026/Cz15g09010.t1